MYAQRLSRLVSAMKSQNLAAVVINPTPTQFYLTGMPFHLMERPIVLIVTAAGECVLVLPELEAAKIAHPPFSLTGITYNDNPATWPAAFEKAMNGLNLDGKSIGVEPTGLRFVELEYVRTALPTAKFVAADQVIAALRMKKDPQEIEKMRKAVIVAQDALKATLPLIHAGVTEAAIASELTAQLLKAGSDPAMPFSPIVSSGPNSANPHASPSDRVLTQGDLLVIDWGAKVEGYVSDLTRTFAIGPVDDECRRIAEIVKAANEAGRAAGKPGVIAGSVDSAARTVIEQSGYGAYFTHRTGHGLGLEGHEPPYMFGENTLTLETGMTFTVEPGIYLPERNGVRIEDNVVITENSAETLSDLPRELITL